MCMYFVDERTTGRDVNGPSLAVLPCLLIFCMGQVDILVWDWDSIKKEGRVFIKDSIVC